MTACLWPGAFIQLPKSFPIQVSPLKSCNIAQSIRTEASKENDMSKHTGADEFVRVVYFYIHIHQE